MIVIYKEESGKVVVRPAFIGFIKNDYLRRTLCAIASPFVTIITIFINLLAALVVSIVAFIKAVYCPLASWKPIWKTKIWDRPRTKENPKENLN